MLCSNFEFKYRPRRFIPIPGAGKDRQAQVLLCCWAGAPVLVRMASGVLRSVPEQSDDPAGAGPLRFSRKNSPLVHMFNFHTDPCVPQCVAWC